MNEMIDWNAEIAKMVEKNNAKLPAEKQMVPGEMCLMRNEKSGMQCTLPQGHKSDMHVAHGSLGYIIEEWRNI